jgi:hypothetical protein
LIVGALRVPPIDSDPVMAPPPRWRYRSSAVASEMGLALLEKNEELKIPVWYVGGRDMAFVSYIILSIMPIHNFYESLDRKKLRKYPKNEYFDLPFRATFSAPSGAGKSNTVLNIIALLSNCFTKIVVVTKEQEALYEHLKDTIEAVEIIENGAVPSLDEYDKSTSKLMILDDLVLEKKATQAQIGQLFIRGRKLGWSTIYISQSYFGIAKTIRINAQEVFLGKNLTNRDLAIIVRDFPTDRRLDEFIALYKRITTEPLSSMRIDIINRKIFRNITEFVCDL